MGSNSSYHISFFFFFLGGRFDKSVKVLHKFFADSFIVLTSNG
jgi:hypothetical protein